MELGGDIMCAKHTRASKRMKLRKYPQRRKVMSRDTLKRLNEIVYCQNITFLNKRCNKYIPLKSVERQKHHIIPLSQGGTNNAKNFLICCLDCHYSLHREELQLRGISLEQFRKDVYLKSDQKVCFS